MTILRRAATIAAITFSLLGYLGHSAPAMASDLDRTALPIPVATARTDNVLSSSPVPDADSIAASPLATVQPLPVAEQAQDAIYASLSDAVAAQRDALIDETQRCLAGAIYFESKGEPLAGQLAVANVIINRSKSGRFPADVCSVVKQRGQFSFVRGGEIPSVDENRAAWRTALAVAKVALNAAWDSPAPKALFFNTPNRRPGGSSVRVAMIGNHVFYR